MLGFESKKEGENVFVGTIKLSDNMMLFRLDDYKLTISNPE